MSAKNFLTSAIDYLVYMMVALVALPIYIAVHEIGHIFIANLMGIGVSGVRINLMSLTGEVFTVPSGIDGTFIYAGGMLFTALAALLLYRGANKYLHMASITFAVATLLSLPVSVDSQVLQAHNGLWVVMLTAIIAVYAGYKAAVKLWAEL